MELFLKPGALLRNSSGRRGAAGSPHADDHGRPWEGHAGEHDGASDDGGGPDDSGDPRSWLRNTNINRVPAQPRRLKDRWRQPKREGGGRGREGGRPVWTSVHDADTIKCH
jgi:hypothetical protein